jgi:hypothetical protein
LCRRVIADFRYIGRSRLTVADRGWYDGPINIPRSKGRIIRLGQRRGSHDGGKDHDSDTIVHKTSPL